jgi:transcriptional regulator with XRE-family HTH domain
VEEIRIVLSEADIVALKSIVSQIDRMISQVAITPEGPSSYRIEMAKRIHGIRSRMGMTVERLSELTYISVRVLEQIEAGTYWPKDGRVLQEIAHALGVQAFDLDPRFDAGGPLSSIPSSPYIQEVEPRKYYSERLVDDGKDSDGSG